jgi:hypothetical protein
VAHVQQGEMATGQPPVSRCQTLPSSLASSTGVWPTSKARRPCTGWVVAFRQPPPRPLAHFPHLGVVIQFQPGAQTAQSANGLSACSRPSPAALSTSRAIGSCSKRSTKRRC